MNLASLFNVTINADKVKFEKMSKKFQEHCEQVARRLMIDTYAGKRYDLRVYLNEYLPRNNRSSLNRSIERYVLDANYGKGVMNNKLKYKYNGSPLDKLKQLERIHKYITNYTSWKGGRFNWKNINDPDYYDLPAANRVSNMNWYTNTIGNRISNYRKKSQVLIKTAERLFNSIQRRRQTVRNAAHTWRVLAGMQAAKKNFERLLKN